MEFPLVLTVLVVLLFKCLFVSILLYLSCSVIIKILFIGHFEIISSMSDYNIMCAVHGGLASILTELLIKVKRQHNYFTHNT